MRTLYNHNDFMENIIEHNTYLQGLYIGGPRNRLQLRDTFLGPCYRYGRFNGIMDRSKMVH